MVNGKGMATKSKETGNEPLKQALCNKTHHSTHMSATDTRNQLSASDMRRVKGDKVLAENQSWNFCCFHANLGYLFTCHILKGQCTAKIPKKYYIIIKKILCTTIFTHLLRKYAVE